jgi:hypothetical protein
MYAGFRGGVAAKSPSPPRIPRGAGLQVRWNAKSEPEAVENYKLIQKAFTTHGVDRYIDVERLTRG